MDVFLRADVILPVKFNLHDDMEAICLLPTEGEIFDVNTQYCALLPQQHPTH